MQQQAGDYPEAAEIYDYEHSKDHMSGSNDYQDMDDYDGQDADKDYYSTYVQYTNSENGRRQQDDNNDMW